MKSCMRRGSSRSSRSKCVKIASPLVWKSKTAHDAIQIFEKQSATPVRTPAQKQQDRVRLCTLQTIEKLSSADMKVWLAQNGQRVPDGSDRENLALMIRQKMSVTTPCRKQKKAPRRPKKTKCAKFNRCAFAKPNTKMFETPERSGRTQSRWSKSEGTDDEELKSPMVKFAYSSSDESILSDPEDDTNSGFVLSALVLD